MIFWDTSAIVPLLVREPRSGSCEALLRRQPGMLVWWATSVECASSIARRERERAMTPADADAAREVLGALSRAWNEVLASEEVRGHAARLLRRHPLRAADALQLGAALTWTEGRPAGQAFATLDDRLGMVARGEGFSLVLG